MKEKFQKKKIVENFKKIFSIKCPKKPQTTISLSQNIELGFWFFFSFSTLKKYAFFQKEIFSTFQIDFEDWVILFFWKSKKIAKNSQKQENICFPSFLGKRHRKIFKNKKVTALSLKKFLFKEKKNISKFVQTHVGENTFLPLHVYTFQIYMYSLHKIYKHSTGKDLTRAR